MDGDLSNEPLCGEAEAGEGRGLAQAPGYQHRGACSLAEKPVDVPFRGGPRRFPTWSYPADMCLAPRKVLMGCLSLTAALRGWH